jgi:multimeric flavodoxin WrbA
VKVLVIYGSSREGGNTELLTEKIVDGVDATRVYLRHQQIQPIVDKRHDPAGFQPVGDDHDEIIRQMLDHDLIIFATPLYWYGMSGPMKDFVDRWSQSLRDPRFDFKNRIKGKPAWVVVTGGSDARLKGLPLIQQFYHIFEFTGMTFEGYLIGTGGAPGQVLQDERALLEAAWLNKRLRDQAQ